MALTVEDGTGLPNADSYETVADTLSRLSAQGFSNFSGVSTEDEQEKIVRFSTRTVDAYIRRYLQGRKRISTQSREFPRVSCQTVQYEMFDHDEIPEILKEGVALVCERKAGGLPPEKMPGIRVFEIKPMKVEFAVGRDSDNDFADRYPDAHAELLPLMWIA